MNIALLIEYTEVIKRYRSWLEYWGFDTTIKNDTIYLYSIDKVLTLSLDKNMTPQKLEQEIREIYQA